MKYATKFLKLIGLPAVVYRVLKHISVQKKFLQQNTDAILKEAVEKNDGSLNSTDLEKINNYYGLAVPAILGEAFCALRGNNMSLSERWASTSQGAMTGLFDDFFDKDYMTDNEVEKMIIRGNGSSKRTNQQLFDTFYKNALQYAPDKKRMQETLQEVYKAQVESKKQKGPSTIKEALMNITFYKGGSSLIFYRSAFYPAASAEEIKLLYDLGGLMQLANDIFDVYKDRETAIRTVITETTSIKDSREFLKTRLNEYTKNAFEIGFSEKNVREFLNILSIGIFSRCFVCLDQLEINEKLTGNKFSVSEYSREQLVCDMGKKINILRSAWSHINEIP